MSLCPTCGAKRAEPSTQQEITVDGIVFRVISRPDSVTIYRRYPRGPYFYDRLQWSSRQHKPPQIGSRTAQVLSRMEKMV